MKNERTGNCTELSAALQAEPLPGLDFLARRRMILPVLLLLAAHRPLAFVIGQSLWLCSPVELLFPQAALGQWAALLSRPDSGTILEVLLEQALAEASAPAGEPAR